MPIHHAAGEMSVLRRSTDKAGQARQLRGQQMRSEAVKAAAAVIERDLAHHKEQMEAEEISDGPILQLGAAQGTLGRCKRGLARWWCTLPMSNQILIMYGALIGTGLVLTATISALSVYYVGEYSQQQALKTLQIEIQQNLIIAAAQMGRGVEAVLRGNIQGAKIIAEGMKESFSTNAAAIATQDQGGIWEQDIELNPTAYACMIPQVPF